MNTTQQDNQQKDDKSSVSENPESSGDKPPGSDSNAEVEYEDERLQKKIEEYIYKKIILRTNPPYFDNSLISASLEKTEIKCYSH